MKAFFTYILPLFIFICLLLPNPQTHVLAQDKTEVGQKKEKLGRSAREEDLNRFMGYEDPLVFRYLSVPYDIVMTTNLKSFTIELNFIFLLLLPLAFFLPDNLSFKFWFPTLFALFIFLCIGIGTSYMYSQKIDVSGALDHLHAQKPDGFFEIFQSGYREVALQIYVPIAQATSALSATPDGLTYPLLGILFVLGYLTLVYRYGALHTEKQSLLVLTYFFGALWLLLAQAIPWYGLLVFPLLILISIYAWGKKRKDSWVPDCLRHAVLYTVAGLWLLMALSFRMTNYNVGNQKTAAQVFYPPLAAYRNGDLDTEKVTDMFRRGYPEMAKLLNQETSSLIYHAGTQIPYFIKKSDARCLSDNFLDFFTNTKQTYVTDKRFIKALRIMGFRYFIIDLKIPKIDRTPQKTLTKKYTNFMNFAYQNPEMELIMTDRRVVRNGKTVNDVFLKNAKLAKSGTFALFRLNP